MTKLENAESILESLPETRTQLLKEIRKGIVGQDDVIEQLLVTLLAQGALFAHRYTRFRQNPSR
jgi:MoxR-like ATPase